MRLALVVAMLTSVLAWADVQSIKSEPNPEKRAALALDNARAALKTAQDAYLAKGDMATTKASLAEIAESVELAYASLKETGKNPSKSPKHFKKAEIATRELLRKLDDFRNQMNVDDRSDLDSVRSVVQKVHESLLEGIMGGKKNQP